MTNVRRRLSAFVVVAALAWPQAAQAEVRLESVYSFPWPDPVNAQFPNAITLGSDGKLYGTAQGGPAPPFYGVIYSMTTSGVFTLLHALKESEGVNPGPLVEASDGNLYGVAQEGGGCGAGWGTVFRISKTGSFKTVHSFGCPGDGARPTGALVLGADQHLYGLTEGEVRGIRGRSSDSAFQDRKSSSTRFGARSIVRLSTLSLGVSRWPAMEISAGYPRTAEPLFV